MEDQKEQSVSTDWITPESGVLSTTKALEADNTENNTADHKEHNVSVDRFSSSSGVMFTAKTLETDTNAENNMEGHKEQSVSADGITPVFEVVSTTKTLQKDTNEENYTEDRKEHNASADGITSVPENMSMTNNQETDTDPDKNGSDSDMVIVEDIVFRDQCEKCQSQFDNTLRCLQCFEVKCYCLDKCTFKQFQQKSISRIDEARRSFEKLTQADTDLIEMAYTYYTQGHNGETVLTTSIRFYRECKPGISEMTKGYLEIKQKEPELVIKMSFGDPEKRQASVPEKNLSWTDDQTESSRRSPWNHIMEFSCMCSINTGKTISMRNYGIYVKSRSIPSDRFIATLDDNLRKEIRLEHIATSTSVHEYLKATGQLLIVLCVYQSRLMVDIREALTDIASCDMKHIILIILHFKSGDTDKCSHKVKKNYTCFKEVIDCFLQEKKTNVKEVASEIKKILLRKT